MKPSETMKLSETREPNLTDWFETKLRSAKYPNGLVRQIYFKVLQFSIEENNCGRPMSDQQQISFCEFYLHQVLNPYRLV